MVIYTTALSCLEVFFSKPRALKERLQVVSSYDTVVPMIHSFACKDTEKLWQEGKTIRWKSIERQAMKKLAMLAAVQRLEDLRVPPGNRLEALKGNRVGQRSIRINNQWRLCFRWDESGPGDVEITDYH